MICTLFSPDVILLYLIQLVWNTDEEYVGEKGKALGTVVGEPAEGAIKNLTRFVL